jgi:hypothetical protein
MKISSILKKKSTKALTLRSAKESFLEYIGIVGDSVLGSEFKNLLDFSSWKNTLPEEYFKKDFLNSQNFWFSLYTKEKHLPYRNGFLYFIIKVLAHLVLLTHEHPSTWLCCSSANDAKTKVCQLHSLNSSLKSALLTMAFALTSIQDFLKIDLK